MGSRVFPIPSGAYVQKSLNCPTPSLVFRFDKTGIGKHKETDGRKLMRSEVLFQKEIRPTINIGVRGYFTHLFDQTIARTIVLYKSVVSPNQLYNLYHNLDFVEFRSDFVKSK